jgi:hypothetical protein
LSQAKKKHVSIATRSERFSDQPYWNFSTWINFKLKLHPTAIDKKINQWKKHLMKGIGKTNRGHTPLLKFKGIGVVRRKETDDIIKITIVHLSKTWQNIEKQEWKENCRFLCASMVA